MAPMSDSPGTERRLSALAAGTKVEVRNRFDGSWGPGFVVAGTDEDGRYRITRQSDGDLLPTAFEREDVRRERSRQTWWV
jgi:hypothetical protein